jgi:hypothetical protein
MRRVLVRVWLFVFCSWNSTMAAAIAISADEPADEHIVYNWYTDRCVRSDIPDAPARAFRDDRGQVHLIATHEDNRSLVGSDFGHLRHSCSVIYQGRHSDDPSRFNDRQWLTSFTTINGRDIFAIVHNEFQGNRRRTMCRSGKYMFCWYNSLNFAVSHDGGYSFREPAWPENLIATLPYTYAGDIGHPVGYFQPTNIVRKNELFYVMFHAEAYGAQRWGECLAATSDPSDPRSWRAWDGVGFNVEFVEPYSRHLPHPDAHVCQPVGVDRFYDVGSLAYDPTSYLFVLLSFIANGEGSRQAPPGAYFATSPDLVTWSASRLILSAKMLDRDTKETDIKYGFYSMIDEASPSHDFSEINSSAALFMYYVKFYRDDPPFSRVLVKRKLHLIRENSH